MRRGKLPGLDAVGALVLVAVCLFLPACSERPEGDMGGSMFAPCPASPNCVSSDARDGRHAIEPFVLKSAAPETWHEVRSAVLSFPRTKLVADEKNYLHAACRSAVLGLTDDLEIQQRPGESTLAVRSAARKGYYDFGVNRRRLETLRDLLQKRGVIQ